MFACGCACVRKPRVYLIADHSSTADTGCHGRCRLLCNKDAVLLSMTKDALCVCVCASNKKCNITALFFKHITLIPSLVQYQRQGQWKTCHLYKLPAHHYQNI